MRISWLALPLALTACDAETQAPKVEQSNAGAALDQLAIEKGLIPDPRSLAFEGRFETQSEPGTDGIVLRFPGSVPEGCASYCSRNASMSGTRYYFVDPGAEAAKRTLGREIERLCR